MKPHELNLSLAIICLFEGGLGVVALWLMWLFGLPTRDWFFWEGGDFLIGLTATVPLLFLLKWTATSSLPSLRTLRDVVHRSLTPVFRQWTAWQFALLALLAGFGEELLFRGVIQGGLAQTVPPLIAWLLSGIVFGMIHWVTRAYGLIATVIGLYLGGLWMLTGNILAPLITHAVYDFVALLVLIRQSGPEDD